MYALVFVAILVGGQVIHKIVATYKTVEECLEARDISRQEISVPGVNILCVDGHNNTMNAPEEKIDGKGL